MWQPIQVTGGVVRSRAARALGLGEMETASNLRLKPGDNVQVHNDVGTEAFGSTVNDVVAGPFYLSFEGTADKLLCVTTDGANSYLETATVGATGTWASIQTITGVVTAATVVHRGDQYFVGTDQGNYVVQDNVARVMGMTAGEPNAIAPFGGFGVAAGSSVWAVGDFITYYLTEYDSTNDVESAVAASYAGSIAVATNKTTINLSAYTKLNPRADKYRIYRRYYGTNTSSNDVQSQSDMDQAEGPRTTRAYIAGLLDEVDATTATFTDEGDYKFDPTPQYPLIATDVVYGGSIFSFLRYPREFTLGCVFNDCLVVNDPNTSKQVIRYSPPGYPEYQPDPYFMYFATERSDEVVGLRVVNDRLVVLTTGAVHRVNYLPLAGDLVGQQGRVQEIITSVAGCVGRHAHAKVQTEGGELVVWLSGRGLEWSNGVGWSDACPDFVGSLVTGSSPVLVNNEALYRLELYDGTTRWDFYYHPDHLKSGKLKMMGPSTVPVTVSKGACADSDYVWIGGASAVHTVNVGTSAEDSVLLTGHIRGSDPFADLVCDGLALTHSGTSGTTLTARVYGKLDGQAEVDTGPVTIPNPELDETGRAALAMRGRYLRAELTVGGDTAWAGGPLWLEVTQEEGPNG